ncbi:M56 family metallopeptidase [Parabacteroides sp. Marseille-P3160]|uniref:M56 family metallopeptidase n=1 Tax=Parabacteroides sp. Marseille-P3160 TaxID=1917887 RepID=UPI0009BB49BF|nr:M56 family metallopeptidase [Parabacteroides sp. Marseille-P3160]
MGAFFIYIVKSSVCLLLFYWFYKLLLGRETFHHFNRVALLGILLLSVCLPFCMFRTEETAGWQQSFINWEELLTAAVMEKGDVRPKGDFWIQGLLLLYYIGVFFFLLRMIYSFVQMYRLIRTGERRKLGNRTIVIQTGHPIAPFSWMNYIVISREDWGEDRNAILMHESAHIHFHHSWDILWVECCVALQWFNPAVWLLKKEIQHIHEYEADAEVLGRGMDARQYQLLLIRKAVGAGRFYSVVNGFNQKGLNKRITMMLKTKSNAWARLKYLYVLPLSVAAMSVFARPEVSRELNKVSAVHSVSDFALLQNAVVPVDTSSNHQKIGKKTKWAIGIDSTSQTNVFKMMSKEKSSPWTVSKDSVLYIIDGVEATTEDLKKLSQESVDNISVLKDEAGKASYGEKGKNGVILIQTKSVKKTTAEPLIIIDGQRADKEQMKELDHSQIESVSVLKNKSATELYGDDGKNGVILITTKK